MAIEVDLKYIISAVGDKYDNMEIVIVKLSEGCVYFKSTNEEDNIQRFESSIFKREPENITHLLSREEIEKRLRE